MRVYTVPSRYRGVVESFVREHVRDIQRDVAEPGSVPRHVAPFAVDDRAVGDLLVLIGSPNELEDYLASRQADEMAVTDGSEDVAA